ncbi:hypothetical protein NFJ02_13g13140 [Pycnococcus provasolii]
MSSSVPLPPPPTTYTVTFVERNLKGQSDGKTKVSMISISMDASLPLVLKTLEQQLGHKPGASVAWKFSIAPPCCCTFFRRSLLRSFFWFRIRETYALRSFDGDVLCSCTISTNR